MEKAVTCKSGDGGLMPRATNQAFDAVFHPVSASVRREASHATIEAIKASRRYDPGRYTRRAADRELSRLWQTAFRHKNDAKAHANRVRLIALVSDSGMEKPVWFVSSRAI